MKLRNKIDIDKSKIQERKQEIDAGMELATKVSALREAVSTEEQQLKTQRANLIAQIQYETNQYIEERDTLKKQTDEARILRDKLLEPLNKEWEELNLSKKDLDTERFEIEESRKNLNMQSDILLIEIDKLNKLINSIKERDDESLARDKESKKLYSDAKKAFDSAVYERETHKESMCQKEEEIKELKRSYEVGITTNEIESKRLNEKENELIIREQTLARRITNLQRVEGI